MPILHIPKKYYIIDETGYYYKSNSQSQLIIVKDKSQAQKFGFSEALYKIRKIKNCKLLLEEDTFINEFQEKKEIIVKNKKEIINKGIKDEKNLERYLEIFDSVQLEVLQELYMKKGAISCLLNNEIYFEREQDRWLVIIKENNVVELWHNNYIKNMAGERYCLDYYHKECEGKLEEALIMIAKYDYLKHRK